MWEGIGHAPKVCNHAYLSLLYPRLVLFWFLRSRRQRQRRSTGTATWWHWFHVREWTSFIQPELDQISSRQWDAVMYSPLFVKRARSGTTPRKRLLSPVLSARKHCLWLDFLKAQRHHRTFKNIRQLAVSSNLDHYWDRLPFLVPPEWHPQQPGILTATIPTRRNRFKCSWPC